MIWLVVGIMFALLFIGQPIFVVFALFGSIIGIGIWGPSGGLG